MYCFHEESIFSYKINLKKASEPFIFPGYTRNFEKRFRKFPGGGGSQKPKCEPKLEFSEGGGSSNPKISVRVVWSIIVNSSSNLVIHNP